MVDDWDLTISPDAFLQEFGSWMGDPYAGSTELLDLVRTERPVACLSNMNELHWESHFSHFPIVHEFDYRFLSFELGQVKPNPVIFDLVAERLPVPSDQAALFLDDNAVNVSDAADAAAGFGGPAGPRCRGGSTSAGRRRRAASVVTPGRACGPLVPPPVGLSCAHGCPWPFTSSFAASE